ncbi:MAG: patatin-like phospholipase family protein [Burkholderiales bacterium]
MTVKKVAIACQGGGTHAAFTWGVLTEILRTKQVWDAAANRGDKFDVVALSGTSAGALCALATWYGLAPNTADPDCGTLDKAIERLDFLWTTFAAASPVEITHNQMVSSLMQWTAKGMPVASSNPYGPYGRLGLAGLSMMGVRPEYLHFSELLKLVCPHFDAIDWPGVVRANRRVMVGAIEVLSGNFELFDSDKTLEKLGLHPGGEKLQQYETTRWRMRRPLSLEGVAASGTLPEVLPAQKIPDTVFPTCEPGKTVTRNGYYWDGLYSQNPPVRDLLDADDKDDKPDEIWVVRINPQEFAYPTIDIGLDLIRDRENDLAGNLALNQELDHILTINRWIEQFGDLHPPLNKHKIVKVRTIKMTSETAWGLCHTSKYDRSATHYAKLREEGQQVAADWLGNWRRLGDDFIAYPFDARYPEHK